MAAKKRLAKQFIDKARVLARGGAGGNGCISFLREKGRPFGGPDGGHGGRGGSVYVRAYDHRKDLTLGRTANTAERGANGRGKAMDGADGRDCVIEVPVGTVVRRIGDVQRMAQMAMLPTAGEPKRFLADLSADGAEVLVASGGKGGHGNRHFRSSQFRMPRIKHPGQPGEACMLELELKLIADIGLIGLPNAGKSSLLRAMSNARAEVGAYAFTTLSPNVGVVNRGLIAAESGRIFTVADIPGLVEGAHRNRGLGHSFLRHVERTKALCFVVDLLDDPAQAMHQLRDELEAYQPGLVSRPALVAANKCDLAGTADALTGLVSVLAPEVHRFPGLAWAGKCLGEAACEETAGLPVVAVSAATGEGVDGLVEATRTLLDGVRHEGKSRALASGDGALESKKADTDFAPRSSATTFTARSRARGAGARGATRA